MNEKKSKLKIQAICIAVLFFILLLLCIFFWHRVPVNYSMSNNDSSSSTSLSIMLRNVDEDSASAVCESIAQNENVLNAYFDAADEECYKDGNALINVIINGSEDSQAAKQVTENAEELTEDFDAVISSPATRVGKIKKAAKTAAVLIPIIAIVVMLGVLLFTSSTWIEPLMLILVSGAAVIINNGTNMMFGGISFVTGIAATVLQLVFSVTYGMIMLSTFHKVHKNEDDILTSMLTAVKSIIKPVAAGLLTTLAGMIALCFTSFSIGAELGGVMLKGMVISAVTSLTLLPALVLLLDSVMHKTQKKTFAFKGDLFVNIASKASFIVVPVTVVLIVLAGLLQPLNIFLFSEEDSDSVAISEGFGNNCNMTVIYDKSKVTAEQNEFFIYSFSGVRKNNGSLVLKSYYMDEADAAQADGQYDIDKAQEVLGISEYEAELIFTMYYLSQSEDAQQLTPAEFIDYARELMRNYGEAEEYDDPETLDYLDKIALIGELLSDSNKASAFYSKLKKIDENTALDKFTVEQLYGMYLYNSLDNDSADSAALMKYLASSSLTKVLDSDRAGAMKALAQKVSEFDESMSKKMTNSELKNYLNDNFGMGLDDTQTDELLAAYFSDTGKAASDKVVFIDFMSWMAGSGRLTDADAVNKINQNKSKYDAIHGSCKYDTFPSVLSSLAAEFSMTAPSITNDEAQQLYIMYFRSINKIPDKKINGKEFVKFALKMYKSNVFVKKHISEYQYLALQDLLDVHSYLSDAAAMNYKLQFEAFSELHAIIRSSEFSTNLSLDRIMGIYINYMISMSNALTQPIGSDELIGFIMENMDSNDLLSIIITAEIREKLIAMQSQEESEIDSEGRIVLIFNMPEDFDETIRVIEEIYTVIYEVYGENAYAEGELAEVFEQKEAFDRDSCFIALLTILLVFGILLISFRSISVPIILTFLVQGAVWITMLTQLFGKGIPFAAYIITTSLLLGSVVDYGIFMTSNYLADRHTMDKLDALKSAISTTMPTILVSGVMLTVCGFVISLISSASVLSAIGLVMGIGSLVSLLLTMFSLPSMLYLLDGFVMKLTLQRKGKSKSEDGVSQADSDELAETK